MSLNSIVGSKKERSFYMQSFMVIGYCTARFFNHEMSAMDGTFVTLMMLLASYHVTQGAIDFVKGAKATKTEEKPEESK